MKTADITGLRRLDTLEVGGDLFGWIALLRTTGDAVISACNGVTVPGVISVQGDIMKGLENAIRNLDILDTRMVPRMALGNKSCGTESHFSGYPTGCPRYRSR